MKTDHWGWWEIGCLNFWRIAMRIENTRLGEQIICTDILQDNSTLPDPIISKLLLWF